tara:strand:- start:548 stop:1405 length:858 start_codon:yes stop_codon:yes gene_type:complete
MLGKGAALSNLPYTAYQGPLTAGTSDLQTKAFEGLGALELPGASSMQYNPMSFTGAAYAPPTAQQTAAGQPGAYTPASGNVVQQYMTPYLQASLDPQLAAARRDSDIQAQQLQSQYGRAGAYGGSRQGVAEAELQRSLLDRLSGITGQGYQQAFTEAQGQFNTEQERQMQAAQQAQRFGLDALAAQRTGGTEQRNIEQQGLSADLAQFEYERDYPQQQALFMQSLLQGMPLETQSYSYSQPTGAQGVGTALGSGLNIADLISKYLTPKAAPKATTGEIIGELEGN